MPGCLFEADKQTLEQRMASDSVHSSLSRSFHTSACSIIIKTALTAKTPLTRVDRPPTDRPLTDPATTQNKTKTKVERDLSIVDELGLTLTLALNTHCHADHVTGTGKIKVCSFVCRLVVCLFFCDHAGRHQHNNKTHNSQKKQKTSNRRCGRASRARSRRPATAAGTV